jgi:hypothetical protein
MFTDSGIVKKVTGSGLEGFFTVCCLLVVSILTTQHQRMLTKKETLCKFIRHTVYVEDHLEEGERAQLLRPATAGAYIWCRLL